MNSAAKLRKRGIAAIGATALIATSFGPAALASWDDAPQTPNIDTLQTNGTIGIVDTDKGSLAGDQNADTYTAGVATGGIDAAPVTGETKDENQGATLVYAGKDGQPIADVRLVLPNRFASGDILDLRLLDRSATEHSDGLANRNADTLVGFSGSEGVTVEVSGAMDARTTVNQDTDAVDSPSGTTTTPNPALNSPRTAGNTETAPLAWTAGNPTAANPQRGTAPAASPAFSSPQVSQTNTVQGKDNLRLAIQNASTGDPDAVWVVTIKGLKVDLGKNATPGELRVVPFLSNAVAAGNGYTASPWFYGNAKEDNNGTPANTADDTPREIGIYTVPAYVSPVTVTSEKNDIVADGLAQSIGKITLSETQAFSLQNGNYTVDFSKSGADVTIESAATAIKAALENGGASEAVTNITVANDKKSFSFSLSGADNTKISTISITGLMLRATTSGSIEFNITGGSVSGSTDSWLSSPAGSSTLSYANPTGASIYPDAALLHWNGPANAVGSGIENRTVTAPASFAVTATPSSTASAATVTTTAGNDALPSGTYTVAPGGATITGPASLTLTRTTGTSYTASTPGAGNTTDTYTINLGATPASSFTLAAPAVSGGATAVSPAPGTANGLPVGTYVYADADSSGGVTTGDTFTGNGIQLTRGGANTWVGDNGVTYTTTAEANADLVIALGGVSGSTNVLSIASISGAAALPQGQYTVNAANTRIDGPGVVLTRANTGTTTWTIDSHTAAGLTDGAQYAIPNTAANQVFIVGAANAVSGIVGGYVTATNGANNLAVDTYYVQANTVDGDAPIANSFDLYMEDGTTPGFQVGEDTQVGDDILNGTAFTPTGSAGPVTLSGLVVGQTFQVTAAQAASASVTDHGVNQKDILAPLDEYTQLGTASAEIARIGGNNRYETAAKVAERWAFGDKSNTHGKVKNAIIASGENFPDALSASYLSQRMGAPILLTMKGRLPQDTVEALRDRQVEKVFVIGGDAAISQDVFEQLANLNVYAIDTESQQQGAHQSSLKTTGAKLQVQRIAGGSRYTTNQLVNMYAAAWGGQRTIGKTVYRTGEAGKYTAIFARGDNFPDALAAGVLTAGIADGDVLPVNFSNDNALPLILTAPSELSESAVAQIDNLDVQHGLIVGGENAVSAGVKTALEDKGLSNTRIEGADRYFTAAAVAEFAMRPAAPTTTNEYPGLGFIGNPDSQGVFSDDVTSYLANGVKFPDALSAAPWVGRNGNVLNLTAGANDLSDGSKDFLSKRAADVDRAIALGLGQAVSTQVLNEANKLASAK